MSAFNNTKFNLTRYNIASFGQIWLEGNSNASFGFLFSGIDIYFIGNSLSYITSNEPRADKGMFSCGNSSATFSGSTEITGQFNLISNVSENVTASVNLSQEAYTDGLFEVNLDSESNLSQEVYFVVNSTEFFNITKMNLSQIVYVSSTIGEVFQSSADVVSLTEYICEFQELTLKPGDVLIIDSGNYNVLYNGENAIHYQSGDWIDNLNRDTQYITISGTNASNLSASILYTERYL